jgi:hypothetical protein
MFGGNEENISTLTKAGELFNSQKELPISAKCGCDCSKQPGFIQCCGGKKKSE